MRLAGTMANSNKIANSRLAVLAFDGREWSAFSFRDEVTGHREPGDANAIPAGVLGFLLENGIRSVRILLEGEVRRLETAPPPGLSFDESSALLANEVAEQSGTEGGNLICAGGGGDLVGALEPCMLCGAFERKRIDGLRLQLAGAGLQFDGVGSLELACAAHWNAHRSRDNSSLVLMGRDHRFVLPARCLPDQPGPMSLAGGVRQVERDPEAWLTRFARSNRYLLGGASLSVCALGGEIDQVAALLAEIKGLPEPDYPDPGTLLAGAARQAAQGRANRSDAPVPLRNPFVPRKRFSHAFIAIPCVFVLAVSFLVPWCLSRLVLYTVRSDYEGLVEAYGPLEKRIEKAHQEKQQVQARYDAAVGLQQKLADRRKPLYGFIHLAYFFSKHAGNSVRLESIAEKGGLIEVRGIYTDPEDGLDLNAELNDFAADKDLHIRRNRVAERPGEAGGIVLALELDVDYADLSK